MWTRAVNLVYKKTYIKPFRLTCILVKDLYFFDKMIYSCSQCFLYP